MEEITFYVENLSEAFRWYRRHFNLFLRRHSLDEIVFEDLETGVSLKLLSGGERSEGFSGVGGFLPRYSENTH